MRLLVIVAVFFISRAYCGIRSKRQQADDQWYYMNRGMQMLGKGLTEILTNQPHDKVTELFASPQMEPADPQAMQTQNDWYNYYYGKQGRR